MPDLKVVQPGQINVPALLRDVAKKVDRQEIKSVLLIYQDSRGRLQSFRTGDLHALHLATSNALHEMEHEIMGLSGRIALPH